MMKINYLVLLVGLIGASAAHADSLAREATMGAALGAVIGGAVGGRETALVGALLGAVVGASDSNGAPVAYSQAYFVPVYYQPMPVAVYYQPMPAGYYQPVNYSPNSYGHHYGRHH
jgi:hypothetical protein